jgi:hypothetical protein
MEIGGVRIPDSKLCVAATDYARQVSEPFLFNHVMRTYLFGAIAGRKGSRSYDSELFYLGAVLHDLGLTESAPRQTRFEVDGADAAKAFLTGQGLAEDKAELVWEAIALHTTYAVPPRKAPEIALVQLGAGIDVGVVPLDLVSPKVVDAVLEAYPRLGFKQAIIEALAKQAEGGGMRVLPDIVADAAARRDPAFRRANICDAIEHAPFAE